MRVLLAIGVHGYLLKKASEKELIAAVRAVYRGEAALSPEIAEQLTTRDHPPLGQRRHGDAERARAGGVDAGVRGREQC